MQLNFKAGGFAKTAKTQRAAVRGCDSPAGGSKIRTRTGHTRRKK